MSAISPNTDVGQEYNKGNRGRSEIGERPRSSVYGDLPKETCVLVERDVAQIEVYTFTASNAGDDVSFTIDGAAIEFVAGADVTATALAAKTAIDVAKAGVLFAPVIASAIAALGVLTITYKSFGTHTSTYNGTVGTTAGKVINPAGSAAVRAKPGRFVAYNPTQGDPSIIKCRMPAASTDRLIGVIARGPYPNHQTPPNQYGLAEDEGYPVKTQFSVWDRAEVHVRTASDVAAGDPVYVMFNPEASRGLAVNSDLSVAGTAQIDELTVTPDAAADVGFHFDALPDVIVTSVDLATDNAALALAFNSLPQYASRGSAVVDAGKIVITWNVGMEPATYTDVSDNDPKIARVIDTAAVAATAATAIRKEGATFIEDRTLAQGSAYIDLR